VVKVDELHFELDDLEARISLHAEVLDLVRLSVGVHVELGKVELNIKGVEAQALLRARLDHVTAIIDRVLTTLDRNPDVLKEIAHSLEPVTEGAGKAVGEVGEGANKAVGQIGEGAGSAVEDVGEGAEGAVKDVGKGAGGAVEDVGGGAGKAAGELGQGAGQAVGGLGQSEARWADSLGAAEATAAAKAKGVRGPRAGSSSSTSRGSWPKSLAPRPATRQRSWASLPRRRCWRWVSGDVNAGRPNTTPPWGRCGRPRSSAWTSTRWRGPAPRGASPSTTLRRR